MKHIYIVDEHQSSKQNGVGTYIQQLLKCFEESGHDVNLLSFNSDEQEFRVERHSSFTEFHFPVCGNRGFLRGGALSISLFRLYLPDNEDNIFIINHFPCDKFIAVLKHHFPKSRIIFVIHDQGWCAPLLGDTELFKKILSSKHVPKNKRQQWLQIRNITFSEKKAYHLVDDIISLSLTTYELLLNTYHIPEEKIHLIPNGLQSPITRLTDEERCAVRRRLGIGDDEIVLLYTGRTSRSKGIIPLLRAFDRLWIEHPRLRLVIAGQVFTFNDFAQQTPYSAAHVTYTGLLSKEQLADWYQLADIGILPSYTEQSSYTGIEMLAYGKLIVTTDGHNITDLFSEEEAIVAPIGEHRTEDSSVFSEALAKAIQKALNLTEEERQSKQRHALNRYNQKYSFKHWKSTYSRLING